jgi:17beta-estradiol 17-dehydrogenase / very-long-chain 3-oxoacyl-CoA reductase
MDIEEMTDDQMWDHVNVNCGAITVMTRMLLKGMKERKRGAIVNLSSISGLGPTPYLSIYGASKVQIACFNLEYFSNLMKFFPPGLRRQFQ